MHLPWGMIFLLVFNDIFPHFQANSTQIQLSTKTNPTHCALAPQTATKSCARGAKTPSFCKTPNTLLQIQRAPTRARQRSSIPTVVATQSPTTKGHLHLHTSNTKPHPRVRQIANFSHSFELYSHISKPTQHKFNYLPKQTPRIAPLCHKLPQNLAHVVQKFHLFAKRPTPCFKTNVRQHGQGNVHPFQLLLQRKVQQQKDIYICTLPTQNHTPVCAKTTTDFTY